MSKIRYSQENIKHDLYTIHLTIPIGDFREKCQPSEEAKEVLNENN